MSQLASRTLLENPLKRQNRRKKAAVAFCSKCGSSVTDGVAFCPQCGTAIGAVPSAPYVVPAGTGLQENVAGLLCYLGLWVTGIIFLLIDKRPFVRFHAAQSIVVFGALFILRIIVGMLFLGSGFFGFWAVSALLLTLTFWIAFVAWIVMMVFAYQGKKFEIPVAAGIAKNIAGSV